MKRNFLNIAATIATALVCAGCGALSQINWDKENLVAAAGHAATALTLSEDQIIELSRQSVAHLDSTSTIENGAYTRRLSKLLSNVKSPDGMQLNFKVYVTDQINAFACGDGSIRVYSGLMDVMDDAELMAIIGHEIGHIVHKDTKKMMQRAYASTAAREAIAAAGGVVGTLASSVVGELADSYVSAQFSQKQEYAADDYGFQFAIDNGFSPYSMSNSLEKLVNLSGGTKASKVAQMFSSHPDSAERAARCKQKADNYKD